MAAPLPAAELYVMLPRYVLLLNDWILTSTQSNPSLYTPVFVPSAMPILPSIPSVRACGLGKARFISVFAWHLE